MKTLSDFALDTIDRLTRERDKARQHAEQLQERLRRTENELIRYKVKTGELGVGALLAIGDKP